MNPGKNIGFYLKQKILKRMQLNEFGNNSNFENVVFSCKEKKIFFHSRTVVFYYNISFNMQCGKKSSSV